MKADYNKSGRNSAVVKMKLKNLLSNSGTESVYKADDKFEVVQLDKKECTYSYFSDPMYVFMDSEYNQYEVEAENMVDALNYLDDGMPCEVVFYNGRAISVEMPNSVEREIETEPAVRGDTSGKVLKPARIKPTNHVVNVPLVLRKRRSHRNRYAYQRVQASRVIACVFLASNKGHVIVPFSFLVGQIECTALATISGCRKYLNSRIEWPSIPRRRCNKSPISPVFIA